MKTILKNKKLGIGAIVTLALVIVLGWTFASTNTSSAQTSTEAQVRLLNTSETVETSGSLSAQPFAALDWQTNGIVESVNVAAGDFVKAGDVLLTLKPASTSSSIVSAKADLLQAQEDLATLLKSDTDRAQAAIDLQDAKDAYIKAKNYRTSLNGKAWITYYSYAYVGGRQVQVPHYYRGYADPATIADADRDLALKMSELEDAQRAYDRLKDGPNPADVAVAQSKVDAAQVVVNSLSIIAPFDGQVLSVEDQAGDTVTSGNLSVNLADMKHLYVDVKVDETDIAKIKIGNKTTATLDAVPGVTLSGKVTAVNPVAEEDSGLVKYKVRVDLDQPADGTFLPLGTTANVVILIKENTSTLAVPITAIHNDDQGEYVLVINDDSSTTRVNVTGGNIIGDLVAVTGDLKEGQRVSTESTDTNSGPRGPFGGG